jgi:HAD superfamily hydrolase (TIGR01509 family)
MAPDANLTIEQVKKECYGKNHDLLDRIFSGRFSMEEKDKMSIEKEKQYQQEFRPHLKLLNGLDNFLAKAKEQHIKMAIGSAAILFNIDFVLDGLHIRHYIDAIVSADDVAKSKPDPETFFSCAAPLNIAPADCLVFEDAPKGVEAAANAGMDCFVLTTMHPEEDFAEYKNVVGFGEDFKSPLLNNI